MSLQDYAIGALGVKVRQTHFPASTFPVLFVSLLALSGLHSGLQALTVNLGLGSALSVGLILAYWVIVSLGLSLYVAFRMRQAYEKPLRAFARATERVAKGDFSVYLPTFHTADRLDYMDVMVMDFNKMVTDLGSLEVLKTDFITNVSHEIKAPLSAIQSNAELLQVPSLDDGQRQECIASILSATRRLSGLVTTMLKLNKLERQEIAPSPSRVNVSAQMCECLFQFEGRIDGKGISINADLDERLEVDGDPELLALVWNNIFSNAVKFTPERGSISLGLRSEGGLVVATVSDTGCGMDEETLGRAFEKFYQGDTSHATEGNGLGLALVRRIVDLSNGTIDIESEQGKGTTVRVALPSPASDKREKQ